MNKEKDVFEDFKFLFNILRFLLSIFSRPSEAFLRRRFGERYFSIFPVLISTIMISGFVGFNTGINEMTGLSVTPWPVAGFALAFFLLSLYHRLVILLGNFRGDYEVFSFHSGESWGVWHMIFKIDGFLNRLLPYFVQRVVEPVFVIALGVAITFFLDYAVGAFLTFSGICLFFHEAINYRYKRMAFLDQQDAKIMARVNNELEKNFNVKKSDDSSPIAHEVKPNRKD